MSKLQHVIYHMDMYRILKETLLARKGRGALKKAYVILILHSKEHQSVILIVLDDCHITRCGCSRLRCLALCFETFKDPNLNVQVMCLLSIK